MFNRYLNEMSAIHKQRIVDETKHKPHNRVNTKRNNSIVPIDHLDARHTDIKTPPKGQFTLSDRIFITCADTSSNYFNF